MATKIHTTIRFTRSEIEAQGYNPDTYFSEGREPAPEGLPVTLTRSELEDQGYVAENHPAWEINVARTLHREQLEARGVSPRAAKDAILLANAALASQVDIRTGIVMTPDEISTHQQNQ